MQLERNAVINMVIDVYFKNTKKFIYSTPALEA